MMTVRQLFTNFNMPLWSPPEAVTERWTNNMVSPLKYELWSRLFECSSAETGSEHFTNFRWVCNSYRIKIIPVRGQPCVSGGRPAACLAVSSAGASRGVVRGRIRLGHRAGGGCVVCAPAMRLRPADVRDGVRAGGASDAERARHAQGWMVAIGGRARCFDKNNN